MTGQILSQSESHAFQSFLSSIDYPDSQVSQEWSMYTPAEHSVGDPSRARGKEALAKATKDLMSLDATQDGQVRSQSQSQSHHEQFDYGRRRQDPLQYDHESRHDQAQHRSSQNTEHSGFTYFKRPLTQYSQHAYSHPRHALGITVAPTRIVSSPPPSAPTSYGPPLQIQFSNHPSSHRSASCSNKRSAIHDQLSRSSSHKRLRLSPSTSASPSESDSLLLPLPRLSQPQQQSPSPPLYTTHHPTHKPTLLSPSQKKANHIQSEQKRRANIRRGYEALCETVPALREAIREEEAMAAAAASGNGDIRSVANGVKGRGKRGRGRGKGEEGEKVDGRAGPRSENVVLSKTIDYINDLLTERSDLVSRLKRAKDALSPGHPTSSRNGAGRNLVPLWEREWKGGEGRSDGAEEEEDDYESS